MKLHYIMDAWVMPIDYALEYGEPKEEQIQL